MGRRLERARLEVISARDGNEMGARLGAWGLSCCRIGLGVRAGVHWGLVGAWDGEGTRVGEVGLGVQRCWAGLPRGPAGLHGLSTPGVQWRGWG